MYTKLYCIEKAGGQGPATSRGLHRGVRRRLPGLDESPEEPVRDSGDDSEQVECGGGGPPEPRRPSGRGGGDRGAT